MKRLFLALFIVGTTSLFAAANKGPIVKEGVDKTDLFAIPLDTDEQEEKVEERKLEKLQQRIQEEQAAEKAKSEQAPKL